MFYKVYGFHADMSSILYKLLNMAAKKSLNTAPATKTPLDIKHLMTMVQFADMSNPFHMCFVTAVSVGFFALLRRSNICPPSPTEFEPTKHLRRKDIQVTQEGIVVSLNWSKTNQHQQKVFTIPIAFFGNQQLDPPSLFMDFNGRCPVRPEDPCFSFYVQDHHYVMTHRDLSNMLQEFLKAVGVDRNGITTHSIRKGGCSLFYRAGIMIPALKEHGTWSSDSYKTYVHYNMQDKLKVTQSVYKFLKL